MKKAALALAVSCISFSAIPAFAQDSNPAVSGNYQPSQAVGSGNWFIGANVGRTNGSDNGGFGSNTNGFNFLHGEKDRRTGYGLLGGYRWKVGQDLGLGVEAGYTDIGNFRVKNVFESGQDVNQKSTRNALRGWMVGVNGKINLIPQWYITMHGGYFRSNDNNNNYNNSVGQDLGFSDGGDKHRGSFYAGLGTGWDINEHVGVGVSYDYFHAAAGRVRNNDTGETAPGLKRSTGIASVNAEYRF